jgi:hypothetical protein
MGGLADKFVNFVKDKTGIGQTVGGRKKQIDGPETSPAPKAPEAEPEMEIGTGPDGMPKWVPKQPAPPVPKMKTGGVIDRELLRRKAAVKQKRGC